MDPNFTEEARRASRFVAVRIVSMSGEFVCLTGLVFAMGVEWAALAYGIAHTCATLAAFLGTKFWAFDNHDKRPFELLRESLLYIAMKVGILFVGGSVYYLLRDFLGAPWYVAGMIGAAIFGTISFVLSRWFFLGSVRDLFTLLRTLVKARSS